MYCWMVFVVNSIDVGSLTDEEIDDQTVSRDDCQMKGSITFFVCFVQEVGIGTDDLFDAVEILIFGTIMDGSFSRFVFFF